MIESLLGNKTLEYILLSIEKYGSCYAFEIHKRFGLRIYSVQTQLKRMQKTGILVSRLSANTRIYEFNLKYPFIDELHSLLAKTLKLMPKKEIELYYSKK